MPPVNQDTLVPGRALTRPLPRLKVIPPKDPSLVNKRGQTDSTLSTPPLSPEGPHAPPVSPSRQEDEKLFEDENLVPQWANELRQEGDLSTEALKTPTGPLQNADLNWPEHRPPTPPFYAKHFEVPGEKLLEPDKKEIGSAVRNANTYLKKIKMHHTESQSKKKKSAKQKGTWSFTNCLEYPRGETPTLEMILDKEDEETMAELGLTIADVYRGNDSDFMEEEDSEVLRDPGIPISMTVDTDSKGRYICRWGGCTKTFARNDHLGRHVKLSHLRVRSEYHSLILCIDSHPAVEHRCEPCQMAFIGVKGLRNHERTHVIPDPKPSTTATSMMGEGDDVMAEEGGSLCPSHEVQKTAVPSKAMNGGLELEQEEEEEEVPSSYFG